MKVLILCNKPPYPPREGGPIAMNAVITGLLCSGVEVKVLSVNSNKYNTNIEDIPSDYKDKTGIELVDIDLSVNARGALKNLILNKSYSIERFKSKDFEAKLIDILEHEIFNIVQIELVHLSPYIDTIRKYSKAKIVLRAHNIEHLIWERIARNEHNLSKRLYIKHVAATLKRYELTILDKYDAVMAITEKDAAVFRVHTDTAVWHLPFGIVPSKKDVEKGMQVKEIASKRTLFHLGSMDYKPNIEGVEWFLRDVWSRVKERVSDARLVLAGRNMSDKLWELNGVDGIEIVGEVENASEFMLKNGVMIVPLLSGSGIRIKIIEGMSLGKTIISTSIGAEGISYENDKNIFIANTVDEFINSCVKCFDDKNMHSEVGAAAMKLIDEEHNNTVISNKLIELYKYIIG